MCQCSVGNKEPFPLQSIKPALAKRHVLARALIRGRSSSSAGMTLCSSVPAVGARTSVPCGFICCAKKLLSCSHQLWLEAGDFQPLHHVFSLNCGLSSALTPIPNSCWALQNLLSAISAVSELHCHISHSKKKTNSFMSLKFAFAECFQGESPHSCTMRQAS